MIVLLTVGDSIRTFSEAFRSKYQSIFFTSASTLAGYLVIRPNDPSVLVLDEITDQGLSYTDILSHLQEGEWHRQLPVIVLTDENISKQTENVVFSYYNPHHLDRVIQEITRVNFSFAKSTEGK